MKNIQDALEKHFYFLVKKGYHPPSIKTSSKEFSMVYVPKNPTYSTLLICYDRYGLPYFQLTPPPVKPLTHPTIHFSLLEAIQQINPPLFSALAHYDQQANTFPQLNHAFKLLADFFHLHFSLLVSCSPALLKKITSNRHEGGATSKSFTKT